MLVISNWPCVLRSSDFEITGLITPDYSVQFLLKSRNFVVVEDSFQTVEIKQVRRVVHQKVVKEK